MKRTVPILLILVFLCNMFGFQILFDKLQQNIQKEIKLQIRKGLSDNELTLIIPQTKKDIEWIKPGKEFRYKGEMYDVVKSKNVNNKVHYLCIWDQKEQKLLADYHKMHPGRKTQNRLINKLAQFHLFFEDADSPSEFESSACIFSPLIFRLTNPYPSHPSPPPRV